MEKLFSSPLKSYKDSILNSHKQVIAQWQENLLRDDVDKLVQSLIGSKPSSLVSEVPVIQRDKIKSRINGDFIEPRQLGQSVYVSNPKQKARVEYVEYTIFFKGKAELLRYHPDSVHPYPLTVNSWTADAFYIRLTRNNTVTDNEPVKEDIKNEIITIVNKVDSLLQRMQEELQSFVELLPGLIKELIEERAEQIRRKQRSDDSLNPFI